MLVGYFIRLVMARILKRLNLSASCGKTATHDYSHVRITTIDFGLSLYKANRGGTTNSSISQLYLLCSLKYNHFPRIHLKCVGLPVKRHAW